MAANEEADEAAIRLATTVLSGANRELFQRYEVEVGKSRQLALKVQAQEDTIANLQQRAQVIADEQLERVNKIYGDLTRKKMEIDELDREEESLNAQIAELIESVHHLTGAASDTKHQLNYNFELPGQKPSLQLGPEGSPTRRGEKFVEVTADDVFDGMPDPLLATAALVGLELVVGGADNLSKTAGNGLIGSKAVLDEDDKQQGEGASIITSTSEAALKVEQQQGRAKRSSSSTGLSCVLCNDNNKEVVTLDSSTPLSALQAHCKQQSSLRGDLVRIETLATKWKAAAEKVEDQYERGVLFQFEYEQKMQDLLEEKKVLQQQVKNVIKRAENPKTTYTGGAPGDEDVEDQQKLGESTSAGIFSDKNEARSKMTQPPPSESFDDDLHVVLGGSLKARSQHNGGGRPVSAAASSSVRNDDGAVATNFEASSRIARRPMSARPKSGHRGLDRVRELVDEHRHEIEVNTERLTMPRKDAKLLDDYDFEEQRRREQREKEEKLVERWEPTKVKISDSRPTAIKEQQSSSSVLLMKQRNIEEESGKNHEAKQPGRMYPKAPPLASSDAIQRPRALLKSKYRHAATRVLNYKEKVHPTTTSPLHTASLPGMGTTNTQQNSRSNNNRSSVGAGAVMMDSVLDEMLVVSLPFSSSSLSSSEQQPAQQQQDILVDHSNEVVKPKYRFRTHLGLKKVLEGKSREMHI